MCVSVACIVFRVFLRKKTAESWAYGILLLIGIICIVLSLWGIGHSDLVFDPDGDTVYSRKLSWAYTLQSKTVWGKYSEFLGGKVCHRDGYYCTRGSDKKEKYFCTQYQMQFRFKSKVEQYGMWERTCPSDTVDAINKWWMEQEQTCEVGDEFPCVNRGYDAV